MFRSKKRPVSNNDYKNLNRSVRDFNKHNGPARFFYNRTTGCFFVNIYEYGAESNFGPMLDSFEIAELYRKTDGSIQVTTDEILLMEKNLPPYRMW